MSPAVIAVVAVIAIWGCALALVLGWATFAILLSASLRNLRVLADALGERAPSALETPASDLTVVVTARDEAEEIERTMRSLLAQRRLELRLVAIDDRSTDATGAILDRIAAEPESWGRLEVVHVTSLPEGWLGKCHACRVGAERARSEWILFTDGDVVLKGDELLARVVALAERERLDHLAVIPDMGRMPLLQYAVVSVFGQLFLLATRAWEMTEDRRRGGAGVGAFNLVRRSVYARIGGHELLRMDPADDVKLGMLLKESGAKQRVFEGTGLVLCPWQRGTLNVITGLEKNAFAGCFYSVPVLVLFTAAALILACGPLALAAAGAVLAFGSGASPAALLGLVPLVFQMGVLTVGYWRVGARHQTPRPAAALLFPAAMLLLLLAVWNSAVRTLLRGGVRWRESFYPLEALRRGLVRPGAGRRLGG